MKYPTKDYIWIQGAAQHNLKNVDVVIPKRSLVVVTGLSGSGKSSLIVDTLYAEGHRRYVESLSTYARQFVARMPKPQVKTITGLTPTILVEQRKATTNRRSTLASLTEIYDYLRILYARVGVTYSPISGEVVQCDDAESVLRFIQNQPPKTKILILFRFERNPKRTQKEELRVLLQKGYSRLLIGKHITEIEDLLQEPYVRLREAWVVVDRLKVPETWDKETESIVLESIETAFSEGHGVCYIQVNDEPPKRFSEDFERDGIHFIKPTPNLFNVNSPLGACPACKGFGTTLGIEEDLVVPDKRLSVADGAIKPWNSSIGKPFLKQFLKLAPQFGFDIYKPYYQLTPKEHELLWFGNDEITGIFEFFALLEKRPQTKYRVFVARYRGESLCQHCRGKGLRPEALYVKLGGKDGKDIGEVLRMSVKQARQWIASLSFNEREQKIAQRPIYEILSRLRYLEDVGLGYLQLNRRVDTLSGGELQRVKLANALGTTLVGTTYILDEPTIGLHPRDTHRLIQVIKALVKKHNTVIAIEHDLQMIQAADYIIELGPKAGEEGGKVLFQGKASNFLKQPLHQSPTLEVLQNGKTYHLSRKRPFNKGWIILKDVIHRNLKCVTAKIPLGAFTVVTGVSGSGKSSLIEEVLYPALMRELTLDFRQKPGAYGELSGDYHKLSDIIFVGQEVISRSTRSNAATYLGFFDAIRKEFAQLPEAKQLGLSASHFSFNYPGGRCEVCEGEGVITVEMQFLADVKILCEACQGKRYSDTVLQVRYKGHSIYDILNKTAKEVQELFAHNKTIVRATQALIDVGLGYIRIGQDTTTYSGGELQRLKLASFLLESYTSSALFIFDEPTTGLHNKDVAQLLKAFQLLVDKGHTLVVIEHHLDVIAAADYIIELGPDSGEEGGEILFQGRIQDFIRECPEAPTAQFLKKIL